jgi:predicted ArsR family transcriptional regulator
MMPQPGEAAADAGREWGRFLAGQLPSYQRLDAAQTVEKLTATMAEIGFTPEVAARGGGYQLRLRQCPFREAAERHQDVVCALHLGLMQGVLAQLRAPVTADGPDTVRRAQRLHRRTRHRAGTSRRDGGRPEAEAARPPCRPRR